MASVYVEIDADEFDDDELVSELESRGYVVTKDGANSIGELGTLAHVEHLAICGLLQDARAEALSLVSKHIGRRLN